MEDLSLHLLDIIENSLEARARRVEVRIERDPEADRLVLEVRDDGKGMDASTLRRAADPFFTTRTTRRFGLGLSMLEQSARATGGDLTVGSAPEQGTRVVATFHPSHIDMKPLGDVAQTLLTVLVGHPEVELRYEHVVAGETFCFDSRDERADLGRPRELRRIGQRLREGVERLERRAAAPGQRRPRAQAAGGASGPRPRRSCRRRGRCRT